MLTLLVMLSLGGETVRAPQLPTPPRIVAVPSGAVAAPLATPLDVGRFVFLVLPGHDGAVTWDIEGGESVKIFAVKPGGKYPGVKQGDTEPFEHVAPDGKSDALMVFGIKAGTVKVAAWGVKDNAAVKLAVMTLNVGGAPPVPPDPPQPGPQPQASKLYIAIIRDPANTGPDAANLLADTAFWNSFKSAGHEWDSYTNRDRDSSGVETTQSKLGYLKHVEGVPLPALLLLDKDTGKKLKAVTLPDREGVRRLVKEVSK